MEHNDTVSAALRSALSDVCVFDDISKKYCEFSDVLTELYPASARLRSAALDLQHRLDCGLNSSELSEEFVQAQSSFSLLMDGCARQLRQRVNSPEECLRLAQLGEGKLMSGEYSVYFKNGTVVTVFADDLDDGQSAEDAARQILANSPRAWIDYPDDYESEGTNAFCDSQHMCSVVLDMDCPLDMTFWYWMSEEWPDIDTEIALNYRQKDCDEQVIVAVVCGDSE